MILTYKITDLKSSRINPPNHKAWLGFNVNHKNLVWLPKLKSFTLLIESTRLNDYPTFKKPGVSTTVNPISASLILDGQSVVPGTYEVVSSTLSSFPIYWVFLNSLIIAL